jgi:DNA-binding response OmpR family regulator
VVLNFVCFVLERAGYRVLRAPGPLEALRLGEEPGLNLDLLLTDVIMPSLSGLELADCMAARHPEARCLFMAGLAGGTEVVERIVGQGRPFLAKPFLPNVLLHRVREVLSSPAGMAAVKAARA